MRNAHVVSSVNVFALNDRKLRRGFTLVELLVALGIIGLLLLIVMPVFARFLRRGRVDSAARQFNSVLLVARLQAVRRGTTVSVAISTDPSQAATYLKPTTFLDANANRTFDTGETIIAVSPLPAASSTLSYRVDNLNAASPSSTPATFVIGFNPLGSALTGSGGKALYVVDAFGNTLQVAVVNEPAGKISMMKQTSGTTYVLPPWNWQ